MRAFVRGNFSVLAFLLIAMPVWAEEPIDLPAVFDEDFVMASGNTYLLNRDAEIRPGVSVTMQPGAVFKACGRRVLRVRGQFNVEGSEGDKAIIANARDDAIGLPVTCSSSFTSTVEFESTELSSLNHVRVSRTLLRLVGGSPVEMKNIDFDPLEDFTGAISGPLVPNLKAENVEFSQRITRTGYYVDSFLAGSDDTMPNINMPYLIRNSVEVPGDGMLRINPGVVVKMRGGFDVDGVLQVEGEPANPVVFSDPTANRHGGAVNAGFTGSFTGFNFNPLSHSSSIRHAIVAITRSGNIVRVDGSDPMIENVLFESLSRSTFSSSALIIARQEAQPTLTCLALRSTTSGAWAAINNDNPVSSIEATDVFWNDPRGPTVPDGDTLGARVFGDVDVEPFRTAIDGPCSIDPPSNLLLDIDGDGDINPVIDGVLLSRYMAGLRGEDLTNGLVIPEGAARRTPEEIERYLDWLVSRSAR